MLQTFFSWIRLISTQKHLGVGVLFLMVFFAASHSVFADENSAQAAFASLAVFLIHGIVYISWMIIGLIGDLISNDIVMHPNVVPTLKLFWTVFRNLVNMGFVVILLFTAIKTIFYNFGGEGSLSKDLPNIAGALVMVNFSWLMTVAMIDASSVLTNYAFAFSNTIQSGLNVNYTCGEGKMCSQMVYSVEFHKTPKIAHPQNTPPPTDASGKKLPSVPQDLRNFMMLEPYSAPDDAKDKSEAIRKLNGWKYGDGAYPCIKENATKTEPNAQPTTKIEPNCTLDQYIAYKRASSFIILTVGDLNSLAKNGPFISNRSIVPLIAHNLLPFEQFIITDSDTKSFSSLLLDILFSLLMSLIAAIAFITLFVILVMRVAVLWMALMLSPFIVFYFFDFFGIKGAIEKWVGKIIHATFVPAVFGFIFSLAFILINQLGSASYTLTSLNDQKIDLTAGSLLQTASPIFGFMLYALVIILFWIAIMWALEFGDVTEKIASTIKGKVQTGASWLSKRPLHIDWIPSVSGGVKGKTDMESVFKGWGDKLAAGLGEGEDEQLKRIMSKYKLKDKEAENFLEKINDGTAADLSNVKKVFDKVEHNPVHDDYTKVAGEYLEKNVKGWKDLDIDQRKSLMMGLTTKLGKDADIDFSPRQTMDALEKYGHVVGGVEKNIAQLDETLKKLNADIPLNGDKKMVLTEVKNLHDHFTEINSALVKAGVTKAATEVSVKELVKESATTTAADFKAWVEASGNHKKIKEVMNK